MRALLDTNILVRHTAAGDPRQPAVQAALEGLSIAGFELCTCGQCIVEFWAMSTRPANANGRGKEPSQVRAEVDEILRAMTLVPDPPALTITWLDLCTAHQVRGRQAFDARLVALMVASGIERLVTLNPIDFGRYPMIEVVVPT